MVTSQDASDAPRLPCASSSKEEGIQPQLIQKEGPQPNRKGEGISRIQEKSKKRKRGPSLAEEDHLPLPLPRGQNRRQEAEHKEVRTQSLLHSPSHRQIFAQETSSGLSESRSSYISHWAREGQVWPDEFFKVDKMHPLLAIQNSAPLRRKRSDASLASGTTSSDLHVAKNGPYKSQTYENVLAEQAGSYMGPYTLGITAASKMLCQTLLDSRQTIPTDTIFDDDVFENTLIRLRGKGEARIFKDCTPLITPWVETYAALSGNSDLDIAIESVNEGWNHSIPITSPRPQPDYAVGFKRSAFTRDQLLKFQPYLGGPLSSSYFMGTYYMHFPFFTCEVKSDSMSLDIADRQNLHSMTLGLRGIVELFRSVNRVDELHRRILTFSVSHDEETVRIYGHFPVIDGAKTTYWRHILRKCNYADPRGNDKWTAYTFTKNVYDIWMPTLFEMICSAIDDLPAELPIAPDDVSGPYASESTGLSQQIGDQSLAEVSTSHVDPQQATPETSAPTEEPASKKTKS